MENHNNEINIVSFLEMIWEYKFFIIIVITISSFLSVIYSLSLDNKYSSTSLVYVEDPANRAESRIASTYGGLAQMAGINLGSGAADRASIVIEKIRSRTFLNHLISFKMVLPNIMAVKEYDATNKEIIYFENQFNKEKNQWVRETPFNRSKTPSYIEAYEYYLRMLDIKYNKINGFISITITHQSPEFAYEFLELIIKEVNSISRQDDINKSKDAMAFFNEYIKKPQTNEIIESSNYLIMNNLKSIMMANIDKDYLVKIIDSPFLPEKKSSPNRPLICIIGFLIGLFSSTLISVLHKYNLSSNK